MKGTSLILLSVTLLWAGIAGGETVILDEDFGSWASGTIDGSYVLPGGWTMLAPGMTVGFENAWVGKAVKCPHGMSGALRVQWTPVDPTTANPVKIVIYIQLGASTTKVEKGAVLMNSNVASGACEPAIEWYEYTLSPVGDRDYYVRDRVGGCSSPPYSSVYGSSGTIFAASSDDIRKRVKWEIVCDDTGAEVFLDDVSQGTFAGAPNGTMDNFAALDIGSSQENWWPGDFGTNGDIWFDRVQVIQGPFGPDPTPTPLPGEVRLTFRDDFETYNSLGDIMTVWTIDAGTWAIGTRNHTSGGSKSLQNATDSKIDQNAEVFWSPQAPLQGFPIRVGFWWFFDAQGGPNDKLDKFARLTNDGAGQAGTSAITFGANWSSQVAVPNGAGLVDGQPTSYANLDGTASTGSNCTTHMDWWEWVIEAYPTHCTITANGSDFLACCGFASGSGAPNADVVTYPWNVFHLGCFYGTAMGRGWCWLDDVQITGQPATGVEYRDWASY
jgi:hypothetical protein